MQLALSGCGGAELGRDCWCHCCTSNCGWADVEANEAGADPEGT